MTDFTRYTKGSSVPASLTSKGSRSTKRQERKKNRGKKGTIYEKDYLIDSLYRLPGRAIASVDEVVNVLHHLTTYGQLAKANQLKKQWNDLAALVTQLPDRLIPYRDEPLLVS